MDETTWFSSDILQPLIKTCLESLKSEPLSSLTVEMCDGLLIEEPQPPPHFTDLSQNDPMISETNHHRYVLIGYPDYPLYKRLCDSTADWMITGKCPVLELPEMYMLNEHDTLSARSERLEMAGQKLSGAYSLWEYWSHDEKKTTLMEFLKCLEVRGVLDLLGVRKTVGSCDSLPPSRTTLMSSFTIPHSVNAKLSVGARALSKHCHRDDSLKWWGKCTGSEEEKNRHALDRVVTILREAAWINIHSLPHNVKVMEVRTVEGYGARWTHDGSEFRGFLEPQMEGGRFVGWRH